MIAQHESWWGNLTVWGLIGTLGQRFGVNTLNDALTVILTITAILWTLEKWRVERVRRRGYQMSIDESRRSRLGTLWGALRSKPAPLDEPAQITPEERYASSPTPLFDETYPPNQDHHEGKRQ